MVYRIIHSFTVDDRQQNRIFVYEALTPYRINTGKDHDFSFAAGEEDNISVLNLTELLGDSAVEIIAAFDMGRPVVVSVADSANEFADVSVVLTQKTVYGTITTLTGMAANPLTEHYGTVMRFTLVLTLNEDGGYDVKLHIMDHMTSGTGGGSVPEQLATSAHVVKADGKVTITERMEDGTDSVTVIEYDENEVPTKIRYFKKSEFKCKCGRYCNGYPAEIDLGMVSIADSVRARLGRPINVNSGLRCRQHNANVGGASASQHMYGTAADLGCPSGVTPQQMYDIAEEIMGDTGGLGLYSWGIHIDSRSTKARWKG